MFSEMIADLNRSKMPDPAILATRFDFAMIKKMGIVRLPPAFRMQDPKINPRSEHLFWAALLLMDRSRVETALSIIAVELTENSATKKKDCQILLERKIGEMVDGLLMEISDPVQRMDFRKGILQVFPEWQKERQEDPGQ